jgi:hypothetical protein
MTKFKKNYGSWREDYLEKAIILIDQGVSYGDVVSAFATIDPEIKLAQAYSKKNAIEKLKYALKKYDKPYLKNQSWLKWRSIYSAPRNGHKFLCVQNGDMYVAHWNDNKFLETGGAEIKPDHWMPLPAAPKYMP